MGRRFTWVIGAGVGALLIFAGVDALRSIGDGKKALPTTPTASTTSPGNAANTAPVPRCAQNEAEVSIEMRAGFATVVIRNTGANDCYVHLRGWRVRIADRTGKPVVNFSHEGADIRSLLLADSEGVDISGLLLADDEQAQQLLLVPTYSFACESPPPYLAFARLGHDSVRRGGLSRTAIACPDRAGRKKTRLREGYTAEVEAICSHSALILPESEKADASEQVLRRLHALTPPRGERERINLLLQLMERQTDVLRRVAAAEAAGDDTQARMLHDLLVAFVNQKDRLAYGIASLWGIPPEVFWDCPVIV
jgi:hypothetical protein